MATTQHYLWASGHFILLLASLRYFIAAATFRTASAWWYKASFFGAIISYAIVCHKSLGSPQPNLAWIRRALLDENVQYFILAMFWYSSRPVTFALLPYAIFSLFHALTFTRTTLMPQLLPPGPPAQAGGQPQPHPLAKKLQLWVKANYNKAMGVVAFAEIVILVRVLLGAITFQNSFLMPLVYAHFLRQRYYHSAFTRDAFAATAKYIDGYAQRPTTPPIARQVWDKVKLVVSKWGGSTIAPTYEPRR
ncbi:hypothetical protein AMATHDRAFT_68611 [Amanita thiersii Skay4041]|uniref:Endoplasmic reticulum protein n=1 Tax=Amanita thiersii Skay4041 TaxID=703135 RepID=A0A2A9NGT6_9AGAR|nr:hypothetical protein AMATHDRAFT_68611 [Amanita thiersii Skay4041]